MHARKNILRPQVDSVSVSSGKISEDRDYCNTALEIHPNTWDRMGRASPIYWSWNWLVISRLFLIAFLLQSTLLAVLVRQQADHFSSRQSNVRDGRASARRRARVVDELDFARAAARDLEHGAAGVLWLGDRGDHGVHNLLHRDPLAFAHPAFARGPKRRQDAARRDGDDAHALRGFHGCHGFDEIVDTGFGGGVKRYGVAWLLRSGT